MLIVDEAGIITIANTAVDRIFDYPAGTLVGQPVEILVPDALRTAHCRLRSAFINERGDRTIASGRHLVGRKRDGGQVPSLTGRQVEPDQPPGGVGNGMDFGRPAASAASDRLAFGPPFPPALQR